MRYPITTCRNNDEPSESCASGPFAHHPLVMYLGYRSNVLELSELIFAKEFGAPLYGCRGDEAGVLGRAMRKAASAGYSM